MRLVTFNKNGADFIGAFLPEANKIIDFSIAAPDLPYTILDLIDLTETIRASWLILTSRS